MVEIKEVTGNSGIDEFIKFPDRLYKGSPYRVTPLHSFERKSLRKDCNPAFEYCDAKYWLAYKGGKTVGRIAGIISHSSNRLRNEKSARFGWIDFIDDAQVSDSLFKTAEDWALSNGMTHMHGPLGFTDMDLEGMLISGFDEIGTQAVLYNYPYYPIHLERNGYHKEVDWIQFEIKVPDSVPAKVTRIAEIVKERYNLRVLPAKKAKDLLPYAPKMFDTLNEAYSKLYGFVALTPAQIEAYTKQYFPQINPRYVCFILDPNDEVAGFGISLLSLSKALIKAKGTLFPFGFFHILKALRYNDTVDMLLQGVKMKYHNKGLPAIFFAEMMKNYIEDGIKYAVSSSSLEYNTAAYLTFLDYENRQHIRRRCYGKDLDAQNPLFTKTL
ncbi:MAG: hypothetical protein ACM3PX_06270 [Omnitrophica WOR_2 bacterium]